MRSLRNRLTLLFGTIVLVAIGVVYVYVVPPLQTSLTNNKLNALAGQAQAYSTPLIGAIGGRLAKSGLDKLVRQAANAASARVTVLGVSHGTLGVQTYPISDSNGGQAANELQFQTAVQAAQTNQTATGTEASSAGRIAEAAMPVRFRGSPEAVVIYSAPLQDVQRNVSLIRRRILIAGAMALAFAILAGWFVARAVSRRVKRLERAAEQVAAGDFSHAIPVDSVDELGQLARAFNEMQRQLAQLDSARKRFIATASHELRTPIFSLGGFLELLEDEELDEATRQQFIGQVRVQVDRLRKLATDLLDLSRLEAGSLDLRPEPVDVGELARGVVDEFGPALSRHRSELALAVSDGAVEATCDPGRLAQIMRILIDNALAHTPAGTDIEVSAERSNGAVRLAVSDRGMGIKRASMPRIFEPFYTSDDAQGSGLGLAIARELAHNMQGRLEVESVPGRTTFTLELPT
jgi:signal transduction histidine kinase